MEEKKKIGLSSSSSFFPSKDLGKKFSPWEALEEAIKNKNKAQAIACFEEIASIVSTVKTYGSKSTEKDLLPAVSVLEKALEDFEKIWYGPTQSDKKTKHKIGPKNLTEEDKFSYWVMRALLHTLEHYVELVPKSIINRVPCLPIICFLQEEIFAYLAMEKETFDDSFNNTQYANPVKYFQGSIGSDKPTVICHPLYDALNFNADKTSQSLIQRQPQTEKETVWHLPRQLQPTQDELHKGKCLVM